MKRLAFFAALFAASLPSVSYSDPGRMTVRDALALASALRSLDGHTQISKDGNTTVQVPWDFTNGSLRLRIANALSAVQAIELATEQTRVGIVREILKKTGAAEVKPGTPDWDELQRQYQDALSLPATGVDSLQHIKASELHLEKNEIPPSVLSALKPILDIDIQ